MISTIVLSIPSAMNLVRTIRWISDGQSNSLSSGTGENSIASHLFSSSSVSMTSTSRRNFSGGAGSIFSNQSVTR